MYLHRIGHDGKGMFSSWDLDYVLINNPEHAAGKDIEPENNTMNIAAETKKKPELTPGHPGKYTERNPEHTGQEKIDFSTAPQWMKFDGRTKLTKEKNEITLYGYGWTPAPHPPHQNKVRCS